MSEWDLGEEFTRQKERNSVPGRGNSLCKELILSRELKGGGGRAAGVQRGR